MSNDEFGLSLFPSLATNPKAGEALYNYLMKNMGAVYASSTAFVNGYVQAMTKMWSTEQHIGRVRERQSFYQCRVKK